MRKILITSVSVIIIVMLAAWIGEVNSRGESAANAPLKMALHPGSGGEKNPSLHTPGGIQQKQAEPAASGSDGTGRLEEEKAYQRMVVRQERQVRLQNRMTYLKERRVWRQNLDRALDEARASGDYSEVERIKGHEPDKKAYLSMQ